VNVSSLYIGQVHDEACEAVRVRFAELRSQLQQRESAFLEEITAVRDAKGAESFAYLIGSYIYLSV